MVCEEGCNMGVGLICTGCEVGCNMGVRVIKDTGVKWGVMWVCAVKWGRIWG